MIHIWRKVVSGFGAGKAAEVEAEISDETGAEKWRLASVTARVGVIRHEHFEIDGGLERPPV